MMLTKEHSETRAAKGAARPVTDDISGIYSIKYIKDNIRIRSPQNRTVTISSGFNNFLQALETFAPDGNPSLSPGSRLSLTDSFTGRSLEFSASDMLDVAALITSLAVGGGETERSTKTDPKPLPSVLFEQPEQPPADIPAWISANPDLKPRLVVDDGLIVLDFTALRMNQKSKYQVEGRCPSGNSGNWGYEVTAGGKPCGWVVLLEPGSVLVTGIDGAKHSKHRSVMSAMFRLSTHLQAVDDNG